MAGAWCLVIPCHPGSEVLSHDAAGDYWLFLCEGTRRASQTKEAAVLQKEKYVSNSRFNKIFGDKKPMNKKPETHLQKNKELLCRSLPLQRHKVVTLEISSNCKTTTKNHKVVRTFWTKDCDENYEVRNPFRCWLTGCAGLWVGYAGI